jgi:hypothetical protein
MKMLDYEMAMSVLHCVYLKAKAILNLAQVRRVESPGTPLLETLLGFPGRSSSSRVEWHDRSNTQYTLPNFIQPTKPMIILHVLQKTNFIFLATFSKLKPRNPKSLANNI